jgi:hypothetical protein
MTLPCVRASGPPQVSERLTRPDVRSIAMYRALVLLLLACCPWAAPAEGKPAQVVLIRHGEKPPEGDGLSLKGRERAAALVPFFLGTPDLLRHKPPVAIYAQRPSEKRPSTRPVDTVRGLAKALKLEVIDKFTHSKFGQMVEEINSRPEYEGRTVLVCWEHHALPDIARAFGAKGAPDKWPGEAFDRCWALTFGEDGGAAFRDLPQRLLFGDSAR